MHSPAHPLALLVTGALFCSAFSAPGRAAIVFTGISDLAGGTVYSAAWGVSADGQYVVGESYSATGKQAVIWQNGVLTPLSYLSGSNYMVAYDVSDDGKTIIGTARVGVDPRAVVWRDGVIEALPALQVPLMQDHRLANAVTSDGGMIVGNSPSANGAREATVWTQNSAYGLGDLPGGGFESSAADVNADGSVIVGSGRTAIGSVPVVWENGVMKALPGLAGGTGTGGALTVSADGLYIGGIAGGLNGPEATIWNAGTAIGLGALDAGNDFYSSVRGITNGGERAIGLTKANGNWTAFLWDKLNGMRVLQDVLLDAGIVLPDWELNSVTAITPDGTTIIGSGLHNGNLEGFVIRMDPLAPLGAVPEPSTYGLAAAGLLGVVLYLRRRASRVAPPL